MKKRQHSDIASRIFLVGCPRSGTTLLQSMLAAHPGIYSFPESHFFALATPSTWLRRVCNLPSARAKQALQEFLRALGLEIEQQKHIPQGLSRLRFEVWVTAFINILDEATIGEGKYIWVEKTPRHLHYVNVIQRYVPRVKFIHLLRNGLDTISSLYKTTNAYPEYWGGKRSLGECLQRWINDIRMSLDHLGKSNHFLIRYENVVSKPCEVLRGICSFLEVEYTELMIEKHACVAEKIILPHQDWIKGATADIRDLSGGSINSISSRIEENYIRQNIQASQERLNKLLPM